MKIYRFKFGFTLAEILIVVAILAVLIAFVVALLKPKEQIDKALDHRRKEDLDKLKYSLEDFYNNKGCYPTPAQICYDFATTGNPCHICGDEAASPPLSNDLELPCDPGHPGKRYLYYAQNSTCPQWYKIYTNFNYDQDPVIAELGCYYGGCGVSPTYGYDYGITSPNVDVDRSTRYACFNGNACVICGAYDNCGENPGCPYKTKIYGSYSFCCSFNPCF